ncbi:MAG: hypothetical protein LQ349_007139 [Xanthoria aureola]|nr:MAG: hypothetical protein LQ349_007139 [Xanthoria aureola]
MHAVVLGNVLALISLSSARPAQHDISNSTGLAQGFPAQYLPSPRRNATEMNSMHLTLPFDPQGYPGFQPVITFDFRDPPARGLEMAQSILSTIYYTWMDLASRPLTSERAGRQLPFSQFNYHFRPSMNPGTTLTPIKIGVACCWILHNLLDLRRWPGHALAILYEEQRRPRQLIGAVQIDNAPQGVELASAAGSDDNNSTGVLSDVPIRRAQRWLRCLQGAVHHSVVHFPSDAVTDDPYFPPQPTQARYTWPCSDPSMMQDDFELIIYPDANAGQPHQLTWRKFMEILLTWSIGVAKGTDSGHSTRLTQAGRLIVEAKIFLQGVRGGTDQLGLDIAT